MVRAMDLQRLGGFIFDRMSATRGAGLALGVVKGPEVVYARGFGLATTSPARAVTPDTVFGAASLTKSFTAIAILQLVERRLLRLDDPVERHVPCPIRPQGGTVRIEHLLAHTS